MSILIKFVLFAGGIPHYCRYAANVKVWVLFFFVEGENRGEHKKKLFGFCSPDKRKSWGKCFLELCKKKTHSILNFFVRPFFFLKKKKPQEKRVICIKKKQKPTTISAKINRIEIECPFLELWNGACVLHIDGLSMNVVPLIDKENIIEELSKYNYTPLVTGLSKVLSIDNMNEKQIKKLVALHQGLAEKFQSQPEELPVEEDEASEDDNDEDEEQGKKKQSKGKKDKTQEKKTTSGNMKYRNIAMQYISELVERVLLNLRIHITNTNFLIIHSSPFDDARKTRLRLQLKELTVADVDFYSNNANDKSKRSNNNSNNHSNKSTKAVPSDWSFNCFTTLPRMFFVCLFERSGCPFCKKKKKAYFMCLWNNLLYIVLHVHKVYTWPITLVHIAKKIINKKSDT
ncbi:RNA binding protein [Reticulomyxa filosa]|uniref:RNA binding protein n=1 Tax=Reticulomyxa filosa TaxID=46433 RepID=X6N850_RETFI|nr:RNA binding protein [Reticulomyxa filosa]|eukprot:ETO22450.1 RNA binding protein [Reticulomyxa filosa]